MDNMDNKKESVDNKAAQATKSAKKATPGTFLVGTVVNGRAMLLDNGYTLVVRGANGAKGAKNG